MNRCDASDSAPDGSDQAMTRGLSRQFRWGIIPATMSWCIGVLSLLSVPFGTYHTIGMLPFDANASLEERMSTYALIAMTPVMLISGCLHVMSGNRWLCGRWITALLLNICAFGMLAIPPLIEDGGGYPASSPARLSDPFAKMAPPGSEAKPPINRLMGS